MDGEGFLRAAPGSDTSFYALLNISSGASNADVKQAYRQMCILFHPDKFKESKDKDDARIVFERLQKAYDVLMDPTQRAVYDIYGEEGIDAGMELSPYIKTNSREEVKAEFERLEKLAQERRLQQETSAQSAVIMKVNGTKLFDTYEGYDEGDDDDESGLASFLDVRGLTITQSIKAPVGTHDTINLSGALQTDDGRGFGNVSAGLRHLFANNRTWGELELGAGSSPYVAVKGHHQLSQLVGATGSLNLRNNGRGGLLLMGDLTLTRPLSQRVTAYWTISGPQSSLVQQIVYSRENTSVALAFSLGIPKLFLKCNITHRVSDEMQIHCKGKMGLNGMLLEYGTANVISPHNQLEMILSVGVPTGVCIKARFSRVGQFYEIPIQLSSEPSMRAVAYGTVVPLAVVWLARQFIMVPIRRRQRQREQEELRKQQEAEMHEKAVEAQRAISLLRHTAERKVSAETEKGGMVVVQAWYGKLVSSAEDVASNDNPGVIDVTIAVQCLVKDSKLYISETSKVSNVGFYDCCPGETKYLFVRYKFKGKLHEKTVQDDKPLKCPQRKHLVGGEVSGR